MKAAGILLAIATAAHAQTAGRVDEETSWEHAPSAYKPPAGLVRGAAFKDRILPMPVGPGGLRSDTWGGDNVKPRNMDNGIEDPEWSFWCMSVHHEASDGKEHLFGVRWPESAPAGHMFWSNSHVYHAVSDSPLGPFKVVEEDIGPGHNVMCYQAKDGTYVLYVNGGAYSSKSVNGPWQRFHLEYDNRGTPTGEMTNHTFTRREDGSVLMVSRGGRTWISGDGLKPFRKITNKSAYPPIKGEFEDPVVWRDEVQYNLIVNDWHGRTAYYLRSKDGVKWVWDQGVAYDVNIARHEDGTRERWYKFERPNVRQDEFGRATHMYFAVLDAGKDLDKGSDNHSSKVIALPLVPQRRLSILNDAAITASTRTIRVRIKAEPGFDPAADLDPASLRFGAPSAVDYGKGGALVGSQPDGKDLVLTFDGTAAGFTADDFAAKLLGKSRKGDLVFGYARMPGISHADPIIDAPPPTFAADGLRLRVENFGLAASKAGKATLTVKEGDQVIGTTQAQVPAILPYDGAEILVPLRYESLKDRNAVTATVLLECGGSPSTVSVPVRIVASGSNGQTPLLLKMANTSESGWGETRQDRDVSNHPLASGSQTFSRGIGTHAPSRQEWLLDGSFGKFSVMAGVVKGQPGSITVEVWADGKRIHQTPLIKSGAEPIEISVPVRGVRLLSLVTTDGGDGNANDHVAFGDPSLTK